MTWTVTHDYAFSYGGAERVTGLLSNSTHVSELVALAGDDGVLRRMTCGPVRRAFPLLTPRSYRLATPLMPALMSSLSAIEGDVLASSYAFAHMVPRQGRLVVYCHSPLRQIWSGFDRYSDHLRMPMRKALHMTARRLRAADRRAALSADKYIVTSRAVQARVAKFYGIQDAELIPPPLSGNFAPPTGPVDNREDFYLFVGRIVEPYKQVGLLIEAFRGTKRRLVVIGDGRDRRSLERNAPENVTFKGAMASEELAAWYRKAQAVVFPSEDDFGMVPMESIASGTPVIAFGAGGALDTVTEHVSGVYFKQQTVADIRSALTDFESSSWPVGEVLQSSKALTDEQFALRMDTIMIALG